MSEKKGYSRKDFFGTVHHYDSKGHKIGESRPGFFGGYTNYDAKGHKVGESRPAFFGGYNNYDAKGNKVGSISASFFGSESQYDARGHKVGTSSQGFLSGQAHYGAMDPNSAGGAAGAQRDAWRLMAAAAAEQKEKKASQSDVRCPPTGMSYPGPDRTKKADAPQEKGSVQEQPRQKPRNQWYIIASDRKYYRTEDTALRVGDRVQVIGLNETVEVLAVVECSPEVLPVQAVRYVRRWKNGI